MADKNYRAVTELTADESFVIIQSIEARLNRCREILDEGFDVAQEVLTLQRLRNRLQRDFDPKRMEEIE